MKLGAGRSFSAADLERPMGSHDRNHLKQVVEIAG
jgi:hypothetical protein